MSVVIKRLIDVVFSCIGILILLPIWLIVSIAIRIDSKGPIFYLHRRVGKSGKEFDCFKFRSMYLGSDQYVLVSDFSDERVTRVGNFIRRTSLDETPQLINILLGDMSVVGPRPALPSQVEKFSGNDFDKLLVKPGLTGWTQVNGRNSIPYSKRMELDGWYAKNWNLFLDLKILIRTIWVLLYQKGIYDVK